MLFLLSIAIELSFNIAANSINLERLSRDFIADTMNCFFNKLNVGLKILLHQGLSEPEFYDDLVYKLKKYGMADFSDQFRKIIICYKVLAIT